MGLLRCNTICEAKIAATCRTPAVLRSSISPIAAVISDPGAGPVAVTMTSLPNQKSLRVVSYAAFPSKYMKLAVAATDFYGFAAHFVDQTRCKMEAPVG